MIKNQMKLNASELFLWEGAALYVGTLDDVDRHHHHAVQICIALENPFEIGINERWHNSRLAIIPANTPHQLRTNSNRLIVLLEYGSALLSRKTASLGPQFSSSVPTQLLQAPNSLQEAKQYQKATGSEFFSETLFKTDHLHSDKRIVASLEYIDQHIEEPLTAIILAGRCNLSESRFIHLFTENTGLPMRRYILWRRIILTVEAIMSGASFTTAAHQAGFADSAHFSRTFRQTFGLTPSEIFARSQNVQVFI